MCRLKIYIVVALLTFVTGISVNRLWIGYDMDITSKVTLTDADRAYYRAYKRLKVSGLCDEWSRGFHFHDFTPEEIRMCQSMTHER